MIDTCLDCGQGMDCEELLEDTTAERERGLVALAHLTRGCFWPTGAAWDLDTSDALPTVTDQG